MAVRDGFHLAATEYVAPSPRTANGYSLVLPPGWRKIPLRGGTSKVLRALVKQAFADVTPDVPPDTVSAYRARFEARLAEMVREARAKGGIDIYLPVMPVYKSPIAASFIVSEAAFEPADSSGPADPAEIVTLMAAEESSARTVVVDGAEGVRVSRVNSPVPGERIDTGSRCLDYILPVPGSSGRWLVIAFSTYGGGSPDDKVATLLSELFEAMMSTFRWGWAA